MSTPHDQRQAIPLVQTSARTVVVEVTLDAVDALAVGQTLRALARDRRTPPGGRDPMSRVGEQLRAAAMVAIKDDGARRAAMTPEQQQQERDELVARLRSLGGV